MKLEKNIKSHTFKYETATGVGGGGENSAEVK
jgi:hypothetical protein